MPRILPVALIVFGFALNAHVVGSEPAVVGEVQGVEIARQTDLHPAIFVGLYSGTVDGQFALGVFAVGVHHDEVLPDQVGQSIAITDGQWQMQIWVFQGLRLRRTTLSGDITGALTFQETDLFAVDAVLNVTNGGTGSILVSAVLDHTTFPPNISGNLTQ